MFKYFHYLVATVLHNLTCRKNNLYGEEIHTFVLDAVERDSYLYNRFVYDGSS